MAHLRPRLLAVMTTCILLAGCAGPAEPQPADGASYQDGAPAEPAAAFEDLDTSTAKGTGIIRGLMVSPSITPIEGATATLEGTDLAATSNLDGAFVFTDLEPRTYVLHASKIGFLNTTTVVGVRAEQEEPPVVKIVLDVDVEATPFWDVEIFQGFIQCGTSYVAVCAAPDVVLGGDVTDDAFQHIFEVPRPPTWMQLELVWESTQPLGDQLNLIVSRSERDGTGRPGDGMGNVHGLSPVLFPINATLIAAHSLGLDDLNHVNTITFAWEIDGTNVEDATGQCIPAVVNTYCMGPGAVLEQEFEIFGHSFFGYAPPPDWRFTDAAVPEPSG